jgi:two-component system sporulation sensor kinase B
LFTILFMISIGLCMLFPFSLGDGLTWDLRRIPFIIGILYGGPKNGVILLTFLLVTRFFIGGESGFYISVFTCSIMAMILSLLSQYYLKMPLVQKIVMSGLLVILYTQIAFFASTNIANVDFPANMWSEYFVINILVTLIATLLIEVIRMNSDMLENLMKAEKLEVVSHLAASISHEVRNPLTACKGFLQLSQQEEVPPHIKQYLGTAIQELDRASDIINDYLTFARPAPEKVEHISIYQEVQNVVNILTPLANMNNVSLLINIENREQSFILGNRKKLEQSLINIVKNGIESMGNGGRLEIKIDYQYPLVRVEIRDEGKGMTQHQINRLGEPYFTTKENGTGLGMMVSYSIIKGMGGQINVDSEIGNWTSFSIEFPVAH